MHGWVMGIMTRERASIDRSVVRHVHFVALRKNFVVCYMRCKNIEIRYRKRKKLKEEI